jgi:hypothetical protein
MRRNRLRQHFHRLERPPLPPLLELRGVDDATLCDRGAGSVGARIRRTPGDPPLKICNHIVGELAARRHLQMRIHILHRVQQFAVGGIPGNQCRPERASLHDAFAAVERQVAFGLLHLAVVARIALRRQHGADLRFEKFVGDRLLRAGRVSGRNDQERADKNVSVHRHAASEQNSFKSE